MLEKIKNELTSNIKYFYFSLLIAFLTVFPQLIMTYAIKHFIAMLLLLILLVLIGKFSKILFSVFIVYINLVNIMQANVYFHWGKMSHLESRFEVAVRSPLYESLEYLNTYIDYRDVFVMIYTFIILFMLYKFMKHYHHNFNFIKKISLIFSIILILVLISKTPLNTISEYFMARNDFISNNVIIKSRDEYLKAYNKHLIVKDNKKLLYDKIIIIQGESVNKHFLNMYGYNKITSPFLTHLLKNKNTFKFNVIAPSNQTRYSVPMIFTTANVEHWKYNFTHSESILSDFSTYGYKTYWISNQGKVGTYDDWISNIAYEANQTIFFNQGTYSEAKTDNVFVHYLDKKKLNKKKEVYVFHLIGSHFEYSKRYTKEHILYKNPKNIIQEYQNTLYFTDYVIKNIFNYFKKSGNVLIIYLSDHGEVVHLDKYGHGFLPTYKDEYDIPLIIYSSIPNSRIEKLYDLNKKHFFNTENMNYIIKYISGISKDSNISYSSNVFSLNPKNQRNYERLGYYNVQ